VRRHYLNDQEGWAAHLAVFGHTPGDGGEGAVMSELPERNGWSIARHAGDKTPDKTQRLLNHASWDTFAAMAVVRRFAAVGPGLV
jgi:hypothetical protein